MGSAKRLNESEKNFIENLKKDGKSNREIARLINRSEKVVRNFLKLDKRYGIKAPTKGNSKLTARQKGQIRFEATKNRLTCREIKEKLSLPVTTRTIANVLNATSTIRWKKVKSKPRLTKVHKEKRLLFAKAHMSWTNEWKNVIFSDEKKFNLDGPDCYSCYWHDLKQNNVVISKRNFGGGSVMVWGAFSYNFKLPICFITTRMNSQMYLELLEDVLIATLDDNPDEEFIFQQDNAAIHVSRQCMEWFSSKNINVLPWPACSPDCNPIENLWGILASKVYEKGRQFSSVNDLKAKIKECWSNIDIEILKKLVDSMPNRIFDVIRNEGGHTKY